MIGDVPCSRRNDRVRDRSHVVGAERCADLAVVIVQKARALLVARVGLGLVLEDRDRPMLSLRLHGLGVPVGALHEPDGERHRPRSGELDDRFEVVPRLLQIRLQRDPSVQGGELVLQKEAAEQLQGDVFRLLVLHVEVHERALVPRPAQDRSQSIRRLIDAGGAGERRVVGGERCRLDADVHARDRPEVSAFEHRDLGP